VYKIVVDRGPTPAYGVSHSKWEGEKKKEKKKKDPAMPLRDFSIFPHHAIDLPEAGMSQCANLIRKKR
jgi:hypothetical protein